MGLQFAGLASFQAPCCGVKHDAMCAQASLRGMPALQHPVTYRCAPLQACQVGAAPAAATPKEGKAACKPLDTAHSAVPQFSMGPKVKTT